LKVHNTSSSNFFRSWVFEFIIEVAKKVLCILHNKDQPNTMRNHVNDPLEVPLTRARANKLKESLNGLVQNIWSKIDLEGLGTFKEHEG